MMDDISYYSDGYSSIDSTTHNSCDGQRCRPSSKRTPRHRRMREDDDNGQGWITLDWTDTDTPKPKKRKKVKVPTDDEQAELLKTAIEKELKEKGESGLRLQCAMQEYRHLHD